MLTTCIIEGKENFQCHISNCPNRFREVNEAGQMLEPLSFQAPMPSTTIKDVFGRYSDVKLKAPSAKGSLTIDSFFGDTKMNQRASTLAEIPPRAKCVELPATCMHGLGPSCSECESLSMGRSKRSRLDESISTVKTPTTKKENAAQKIKSFKHDFWSSLPNSTSKAHCCFKGRAPKKVVNILSRYSFLAAPFIWTRLLNCLDYPEAGRWPTVPRVSTKNRFYRSSSSVGIADLPTTARFLSNYWRALFHAAPDGPCTYVEVEPSAL